MKKPVLIQGPMESEINYLLSKLQGLKHEVIKGFDFWTGNFDEVPVVISLTHIGMANAVLAAAVGIEEYDPEYVITQGTSGAHNPHLRRGDIVIGQKMVNIDAYQSSQLGFGEGVDVEGYDMLDTEVFDGSEWGVTKAIYADTELVNIAKETKFEEGKKIVGCIGTGSSWNCEIDKIKMMHEKWGTDVEEMENFAVAQVCLNYGVPYLPIRVVSNSELTGEEFDEKSAENCQKLVLEIIKNYHN